MPEDHDDAGSLEPSATPSAEDLRDILDDVLLLIARSESDDNARRELADDVSGALQAVYAALSVSNDAGAYRDAMVIASMQIEDAITSAAEAPPDQTLAEAGVALERAQTAGGPTAGPARPVATPEHGCPERSATRVDRLAHHAGSEPGGRAPDRAHLAAGGPAHARDQPSEHA